MTVAETQQIAQVAERACKAVINHPKNERLQVDLFDVLAPLTKLAQADDTAYAGHLHDLVQQAGVRADIVRNRINDARPNVVDGSAASIGRPARDLQQLLSQLIGELEQPPDV
jgi:hypothetical protein